MTDTLAAPDDRHDAGIGDSAVTLVMDTHDLGLVTLTLTDDDLARYWSRVDRSAGDDACWNWIGTRNRGYGRLMVAGRYVLAHRIAWTIAHGPFDLNLFVCHHCDNPPCVNLAHLFVGTAADNLADMHRKGRDRPGWPNPLTPKRVQAIRALHAAGVRPCELVGVFRISPSRVGSVVNRRTWRDVPDVPLPADEMERLLTKARKRKWCAR